MWKFNQENDFEVARRLQEQEIKRAKMFQDIQKESMARTNEMREKAMKQLREQTERAQAEYRQYCSYTFPSERTPAGATANPPANDTETDVADGGGGDPPEDHEDRASGSEPEEEMESGAHALAGSGNAANSVDDSIRDLVARGLLPPSALTGTVSSGAGAETSGQDSQEDQDERPRRNSFGIYGGQVDSQGRRNSFDRSATLAASSEASSGGMNAQQGRHRSVEDATVQSNPNRRSSLENSPGAAALDSNPQRRSSLDNSPWGPGLENVATPATIDSNPRRRSSLETVATPATIDSNPRRRSSLENTPPQPSVPAEPSLRDLANADADVVAAIMQSALTIGHAQAGAPSVVDFANPQLSLPNARRYSRQNFKELISNFEAGIHSLVPCDFDQEGYPEDWDKSLPYVGDSRIFQLQELQAGDDIYEAVCQDFIRAGLEVFKVERLQNSIQLDRFKSELEHVKRFHSATAGFKLNVQYLYHGTTADKLRLCEEGLDSRLGYQGCFGRGIYFSDHPRKCMQYAKDRQKSQGYILMCRVILGESKIYPKGLNDPNLKREPEKPDAKGGWRFYDSVIGCPVDFNEYVVYQNARAMVEYIVTFGQLGPITPNHPKAAAAHALLGVPPPSILIPLANGKMDYPDDDDYEEHINYIASIREEMKIQKAKDKGIPYVPSTPEELQRNREQWNKRFLMHCPTNSPIYQGALRDMNGLPPKPSKTPKTRTSAISTSSTSTTSTSNSASPAVAAAATTTAPPPTPTSVIMWSSSQLDEDVASPRPSQPAFTTPASLGSNPGLPAGGDEEEDAVQHVMSSQIADFLTITNTDDVDMAKHYLTISNMDLDGALMAYYDNM